MWQTTVVFLILCSFTRSFGLEKIKVAVSTPEKCKQLPEARQLWETSSGTGYNLGAKSQWKAAKSATECKDWCTKASTVACTGFQFLPQTKQCRLTTGASTNSALPVVSGSWSCVLKESKFYLPMEQVVTSSGTTKIVGRGVVGVVEGRLSRSSGKVGQGIVNIGTSRIHLKGHQDCLKDLKKCTGGFTQSFWFEDKSKGTETKVFAMALLSDDAQIAYYNGKVLAQFQLGMKRWLLEATVPVAADVKGQGHWHHVIVTWRKSSGVALYFDGKFVKEVSTTKFVSLSKRKNQAYIGPDKLVKGKAQTGDIIIFDEVRFWDVYLSKLSAKALYDWEKLPRQPYQGKGLGSARSGNGSHVPGVPDSMYHLPMQAQTGKTILGSGISGTMVGKGCGKLESGWYKKGILLNPQCYVDLGNRQNECLGNLAHCKGGFSMSFWYHIRGKAMKIGFYHMSSGGQYPQVIFEAAAPDLKVQIEFGGKVWFAYVNYLRLMKFKEIVGPKIWHQFVLTWNQKEGLVPYIDGKKAKARFSRKRELTIKGKRTKSQKEHFIIGAPPGIWTTKKVSRMEMKVKPGTLSADEIRFWNVRLTGDEVKRLYGWEKKRGDAYQKKQGKNKPKKQKKKKRRRKKRRGLFGLFGK